MTALAMNDFAGREGTAYEVEAEGERFELVLEDASELPSSSRPEGGFRLGFRGPSDPILPQATYPFRAGDFACEIFIVPIGRDADGTIYEAIFN